MSNTLFLTQRYPPGSGPAIRRLGHLVEAFKQEGKVFVIRRGSEQAGSGVISIEAKDLRGLMLGGDAALPAERKEAHWFSLAVRLRQAYPFLYLTDDGGPLYRRRALAEARKLVVQEKITTIFSSFRPWSDHLVARRLKAEFPQLYWVADFRDLPVDPVRQDVWWPALQRWWGKRMITTADEVWTVSRGQKIQLADWHPRIVVQRNALLSLPPEENTPVTKRFTIAYTGSIYPGLQTVAPLVAALRNLLADGRMRSSDLCLQYRGKDAGVFERWTQALPPDCCDIGPSIAPAAAQKLQEVAQILLLLNWSAPGYYGVLTAKLWDYLATGRPVLALVNGPGDEELAEIIQGAAAGAIFRTEEQGALEKWLLTAYQSWQKKGHLPCSPNRDFLKNYLH